MSSPASPLLQTVVFADLDSGVWGVAWGRPGGALGAAQLQRGSAATGAGVSFDGTDESEDWRLAGEAGALTVSPLTDPVSSATLDGFDQLCEVKGTLRSDEQQPIRALGVRAARAGIDPATVQSLREASVWFAPDDGLALSAVRPAGARGHDRDLIVGSVFEPRGVITVADPRLSTTYAADGSPARAGLELWTQAEGDESEYPHRAAGEAIGAQLTLSPDGFNLHAHAMRWHSRGRDGIGVYVLAQPR